MPCCGRCWLPEAWAGFWELALAAAGRWLWSAELVEDVLDAPCEDEP